MSELVCFVGKAGSGVRESIGRDVLFIVELFIRSCRERNMPTVGELQVLVLEESGNTLMCLAENGLTLFNLEKAGRNGTRRPAIIGAA